MCVFYSLDEIIEVSLSEGVRAMMTDVINVIFYIVCMMNDFIIEKVMKEIEKFYMFYIFIVSEDVM